MIINQIQSKAKARWLIARAAIMSLSQVARMTIGKPVPEVLNPLRGKC